MADPIKIADFTLSGIGSESSGENFKYKTLAIETADPLDVVKKVVITYTCKGNRATNAIYAAATAYAGYLDSSNAIQWGSGHTVGGTDDSATTYTDTITPVKTPSYGYVIAIGARNNINRATIDVSFTNISAEVEISLASYKITTAVTPTGSGTVSGGGTYERGSTATLKATPATGYKFKRWSDGVTTATRTVTVTGAATYTAEFVKVYSVKFAENSTSGYGTITGVTEGTYEEGTVLTFTAVPNEGYKFKQWAKIVSGTSVSLYDNPLTLTVTESINLSAFFEKLTYAVTTAVTPTGSGTVTGGGTYEHGSTATLTATPATGYKFKQWNDGNTNATRTVTVTAAATYTAVFERKRVPVYIGTSQCTAVYVDEANKKIYFYGSVRHTSSNGAFDTVDGWHLEATDTIPTGASIKEVKKIYIGTTLIYPT